MFFYDMGINIHAGSHGPHVYIVAKLMRIDVVLVTPGVLDASWQQEYEYTLEKLLEWTKHHQEWALWHQYISSIQVAPPNPSYTDIYVQDGNTLDETITNFLQALEDSGSVIGLSGYLKNSVSNRKAIKKTWELVLGRTPGDYETEFWNERTGSMLSVRQYNLDNTRAAHIDYFTLLMLLTWSGEGRGLGLHLPYVQSFRTAIRGGLSVTIPRTAVILCGHSRDYFKHTATHKAFIDNPYCDVFVHTWLHKGPRSYTGEGSGTIFEHIDTALLQQTYAPVKLQIEDLEPMRPTFTMLDDPLFFNMKQQHDNASFYVNAGLYSFWKASLLVKEYEQEHGFTYGAVMKMSFIYSITTFDYKTICDQLQGVGAPRKQLEPSNCGCSYPKKEVYSAPPPLSIDGVLATCITCIYMSAGCNRCTMERGWPYLASAKIHSEHANDLGVIWMYGGRAQMLSAAELYLHAYAIAESVKDDNIEAYVNVAKMRKYREFVYVFGEEYVNKKIYDIDDLPMRVQGFYYDNLFRMFLKDVFCVASEAIKGELARFDKDRYLVW